MHRMSSCFLTLWFLLPPAVAMGQSNALYLPFRTECMQLLEPEAVKAGDPDLAYVLQTETGRCTLYATVNIIRTYNPPPVSSLCRDFPAPEALCELINGKKRYAYVVHYAGSYSMLVPLGAANLASQPSAAPGFFAGNVKIAASAGQALKTVERCHDRQFKTQPQPQPAPEPTVPQPVAVDKREHTVQSGETLSSIARHYGLTPKQLAEWNKIDNPSLIKPGKVLKLFPPAAQTEKTYNKEVPKVVLLDGVAPQFPENIPAQHTVEAGETLVSIANRYKISAQLLAELNRININEILLTGQILQLPRN